MLLCFFPQPTLLLVEKKNYDQSILFNYTIFHFILIKKPNSSKKKKKSFGFFFKPVLTISPSVVNNEALLSPTGMF